MGKKTLVSEAIAGNKILSHGKILSLADGFALPNLVSFILYVRPKDNADVKTTDIGLNVRCLMDDCFKEAPFKFNEWSPLYIDEIAAGQDEILSKVDMFWGAGEFIIKGKGEVKTKPCAKVLTYTGKAQELVTAGKGTGAMMYKLDNGEWSEDIPTATDADRYKVYYKSATSEFYEESLVESLDLVVKEKFLNTPSIVLTPNSFTYSGKPCVPSVELRDGQRVIPAKEYTVVLTSNINAGKATVTIKDNIAGNYEVLGSTTFNIAKANPTYTAPTAKNGLKYAGGAQNLLNAGRTSDGTIMYSIDNKQWGTTIPTAKDAGNHTIYWKVVGNANHNDVAASSIECSIAKANRTLSFVSAPKRVLIGENAVIAALPSIGGGEVSYSTSDENVATVNGNVVTGVAEGDCNIIATIAADDNYESATVQIKVSTITQKDYSTEYLTFVPVEDSTFGFSKSGLSYSLDNGSTWEGLDANGTTPTVKAGEKIMWKNHIDVNVDPTNGIGSFTSSKEFNVQGNVMSLVHGSSFENKTVIGREYQFVRLFAKSKVVDASSLILPATELLYATYWGLFRDCKNLVSAPQLPATEICSACYAFMFCDCPSLVNAPELPALKLKNECYSRMFCNCSSLKHVKMLATEITANSPLYSWLDHVATSGTFVKNAAATWNNSAVGIPSGWTVETTTPKEESTTPKEESTTPKEEANTSNVGNPADYLIFVPAEDSTFGFSKEGLSYSLDEGKTWTALDANDTTPTVTAGSKILWKNNKTLKPVILAGIGSFTSSGKFKVCGNIMSLLFGDSFVTEKSLQNYENAFYYLFRNTKVTDAANLILPATTLSKDCYNGMFKGCTLLTTTPNLPAVKLSYNCYNYMFGDCTSLTTAPFLPATQSAEGCYNNMFKGCTSLNYIKVAIQGGSGGFTYGWLDNVAKTGTFVKSTKCAWSDSMLEIPSGWTVNTYTPAA